MAAYCPSKNFIRDTIRLYEVIMLLFETLDVDSYQTKLVLSGSRTTQDNGRFYPRLSLRLFLLSLYNVVELRCCLGLDWTWCINKEVQVVTLGLTVA